ncbi:MAG TPA: hypothetical protein PLI32_12990 [Deltaproteobacteria bacterium]|jgi:hypothetical protein|nr:hypothetical protein [Deltaproteobacteria bacterium]
MVDFGWMMKALELEVAIRPGLQACDAYKLVYQAALGADHLLAVPRRKAETCLAAEWESAWTDTPDLAEIPIQVLDPVRGVARLHLGPFRRMGAELDSVLEAVLEQPSRTGSPDALASLWGRVASAGDLLPPALRSLDLEGYRVPEGSPHHSAAYGPVSYRILNDWSRVSMIRFHRPQSISATADR